MFMYLRLDDQGHVAGQLATFRPTSTCAGAVSARVQFVHLGKLYEIVGAIGLVANDTSADEAADAGTVVELNATGAPTDGRLPVTPARSDAPSPAFCDASSPQTPLTPLESMRQEALSNLAWAARSVPTLPAAVTESIIFHRQ